MCAYSSARSDAVGWACACSLSSAVNTLFKQGRSLALGVLLQVDRAKVLSNTIKQKRKQKAGKWEVPLPKVSPYKQTLSSL